MPDIDKLIALEQGELDHEQVTSELRWNTCNAQLAERLEQKWRCQEGQRTWTEWRELPSVHELNGIRTYAGSETKACAKELS